MNRHGHQLAAVTLTLAVLPAATSPLVVGGVAAIASATSHGRLSPDVDQRVRWLAHRTLTHTLEIVAMACIAVATLAASLGVPWVGWGVALGWGSHLLADAIFGAIPSVLLGGQRTVRRRSTYRGTIRSRQHVQTRRVGFRLRTGGPAEVAAYGILPVAIVGLAVVRLLGLFPW